jgi:drug/metabolite transporter (DMT)-like permease
MAFILALGSAILYGAADFIGGLTTRRAGTIPVVVLSQATGLLLLAIFLPFVSQATPARLDFVWGAVAGLAGGVGVALLYHALAIGVMAVVAPTTAVCAVTIPVLFSMLVIGERPVPLALAGIALGIVSIVLVSQQSLPRAERGGGQRVHDGQGVRGEPKTSSGVGAALVSGIAIGFFFLALAQTRSTAGMWPLLASRATSSLLFALVLLVGRHSLRMPRDALALAVACGTVDTLANILYLMAARQEDLSLVVTLSSLYPASTVVLARVLLGERLSLMQVTGVGCALTAVVLIVSGGK